MIKIDRKKYTSKKMCATIRGNHGTAEPVDISFIQKVYVDDKDEIDYITYYPNDVCGLCLGAHGHQIDRVWYEDYKIDN